MNKKDIQKIDVDNLMKNYDLLLDIVTLDDEIFNMKPNLTLSEFLIDAKKILKHQNLNILDVISL